MAAGTSAPGSGLPVNRHRLIEGSKKPRFGGAFFCARGMRITERVDGARGRERFPCIPVFCQPQRIDHRANRHPFAIAQGQAKGLSMGSVALRECRRSYEWLLRPCAMALVLIGHIGLLMIMLRPATPSNEALDTVAPNEHDAVQVRLLRRTSAKTSTVIPERGVATPSRPAMPTHRATRQAQTSNNITPMPPSPDQTPLVLTPAVSSPSGTYVEGGASFQQNLQAAEQPSIEKVPGGHQPRAPRFAMRDPRYQGVAGVVRLVQRLILHAENPHCVDVNTWAGMSPAEQAQHASLSEMEAIAEKYGCLEPERFPNTTH
jgi:hypothetical protein